MAKAAAVAGVDGLRESRVELRALVDETRQALVRGEDGAAAAAARHILETYPLSLSAHQMLGESLIEQGVLEEAHAHFRKVISIDPLNAVACLGLGVIAEEQQDAAGAHGYYLSAWQTHPEMDHLRDELVRIQEVLGGKKRLHPTRTALAMTYARGGERRRAISELRAVTEADADDAQARLTLATLLWQSGDDAGAMSACRAVRDQLPDCARALAMLAEIENRQQEATPDEIVARFRALDPVGTLVDELAKANPGRDLGFLMGDAEIAVFDMPLRSASGDVQAVAPSEGEGAESMNQNASDSSDPWESMLREMSGETATTDDVKESPLVPFSWNEDAPLEDMSVEFTDEQLEAARPDSIPSPNSSRANGRGLSNDILDPGLEPFQLADILGEEDDAEDAPDWGLSDQASAAPAAPDTSQAPIDLTAGWDDLDRTLSEATPDASSLAGFDDLVQGFEAEGITPLDRSALGGEAEWQPRSADEWEADLVTDPAATDSRVPAEPASSWRDLSSQEVLGESENGEYESRDPSSAGDEAAIAETADASRGSDEDDHERDNGGNAALSDAWGDLDVELESGSFGGENALSGYTRILRGMDENLLPVSSGSTEGSDEGADNIAASSSNAAPDNASLDELFAASKDSFISPAEISDTTVRFPDHAWADEDTGDDEPDTAATSDAPMSRFALEAEGPFAPGEPGLIGDDQLGTSPWPRFAPGLAGLGQSAAPGFKLFARLGEEKQSLVELGIVEVDRHISDSRADVAPVLPDDEPSDEDAHTLDRETVRRLRMAISRDSQERDAAARELEALARLAPGVATFRLLGEAYLRMNRPNEASDQFRRAFELGR